jgi:hypothetical protein
VQRQRQHALLHAYALARKEIVVEMTGVMTAIMAAALNRQRPKPRAG